MSKKQTHEITTEYFTGKRDAIVPVEITKYGVSVVVTTEAVDHITVDSFRRQLETMFAPFKFSVRVDRDFLVASKIQTVKA